MDRDAFGRTEHQAPGRTDARLKSSEGKTETPNDHLWQQRCCLFRISKGVHSYLKENDVPHIWYVDDQAHDAVHWSNALYNFAQKIFR